MAIEEEAGNGPLDRDGGQQRNSRGSGSGTSVANNTTATDSVDIEAIEPLEQTDGESSHLFTPGSHLNK